MIWHNFIQQPVVNTFFQEKTKHHNWKDGSKETPKLGPYWKLQPVIFTVICQLEKDALKQNAKNCMSIEAQSQNHEENFLALHQESFPWKEGIGSILNQGNILSPTMRYRRKQRFFFVIHNICIEKKAERFTSVVKENLESQFPQSSHWPDARWRACLEAGGGERRRFQYCTDASRTIVYFRVLEGHLGRILNDLSLQDKVVISSNFFQDIYRIGCAFNLDSIINSGLIPEGQSSSKRQTVFSLLVDPLDKSHKDPNVIDLNEPRYAQYLHNAWKRHQDVVKWCRHQCCCWQRIDILSETMKCNHLPRNTSSLLYPESCQLEKWTSLIRKSVHVTSASAKDLFETRMEKRIRFRTRSTIRSWAINF